MKLKNKLLRAFERTSKISTEYFFPKGLGICLNLDEKRYLVPDFSMSQLPCMISITSLKSKLSFNFRNASIILIHHTEALCYKMYRPLTYFEISDGLKSSLTGGISGLGGFLIGTVRQSESSVLDFSAFLNLDLDGASLTGLNGCLDSGFE